MQNNKIFVIVLFLFLLVFLYKSFLLLFLFNIPYQTQVATNSSFLSPFFFGYTDFLFFVLYSLLTDVAELLQAFMYPMSWGHVYVPVLPRGLFDVIKAPMPFLLGTNTEWMDAQFYEDVLNQGNSKNYFFAKKKK